MRTQRSCVLSLAATVLALVSLGAALQAHAQMVGTCAGDLTGTYPNCTVSTINGQTPGTAVYQNASSFSLKGGYQSNTLLVGPGGVLLNEIVTLDSAGNAVLPTTNLVYAGVAASTQAAGASVEVITGGLAACIFDGSATVGDIAVPSLTMPGQCHDSGQSSGNQITLGMPVVGTIRTATSGAGVSAQIYLFGTGVTGTANPLPYAPGAGFVPVSTGAGTAYTAQSVSSMGGNSGGAVTSINGQTGSITLTASSVGADASGAAQTANAVTVNGAMLPTNTANIYWNANGQATALLSIAGVSIFGDSYFAGWGESSAATGLNSLLQRNTPAPVVDVAIGGATEGTVTDEVTQTFVPDPYHLNVVLLDGGANDGAADTCANTTSTPCATDYIQLLNAAVSAAAIPYANRVMASKATLSGAWAAVAGLYAIQTTASPGTPMTSSAAGASLTFSLPSSAATKVGLNYLVANAATGTFTVTIDGTSVLNSCTGTATFSAAPCTTAGLLPGSQTVTSSTVRQEFAVTPNLSHTVVVKLAAAAPVTFNAVDYIVPGPAAATGNNLIYVMGPNAAFRYAAEYDSLTKAVVTQLYGDGLPVFFMDQQSTTSPGPGVNATSDIYAAATASCPAASRAGHPNDCGYVHMLQTLENEEVLSGYRFSANNAGNSATSASIGQASGALNIQTPSDAYLTANEMNTYSSAAPINTTTAHNGAGIWFLREGIPGNNGTADWGGFSAGKDTSSGLYPFSSRYITRSVHTNNAAWDCSSYLAITPASATVPATFGESNYTYTNCRRNSDGTGWQKGVQGYAEGTALASGVTISPVNEIVHVTGTATIATITVPAAMAGTSNSGGCLTLIADGAWSTTTTGNIYAAITVTPGMPYLACYTNSTAKWYLK